MDDVTATRINLSGQGYLHVSSDDEVVTLTVFNAGMGHPRHNIYLSDGKIAELLDALILTEPGRRALVTLLGRLQPFLQP